MIHGHSKPFSTNPHYGIDYVTDAGRVISNNMASIHVGDTFSAHTAVDLLTYGEPWDVLFQTPREKYIHLKFLDAYVSAGSCRIQIWEDIDSYTGGEIVDMFNRRRPSLIPTTTLPPTTTPGPTTTATTTTGTTTTGTTTTTATTTTATTTTATTTTAAPVVPLPISAEADLRLTWAEEYRHVYDVAETLVVPTHSDTSGVLVMAGGVGVLGAAVEIDAYSFAGANRICADRFFDHEWILRKNIRYLIRFQRITPVPAPTTTTTATTTTAGPVV